MEPSLSDKPEAPPVESRSQLVEYLAAGCRPPEEFRLGVEQEVFVYRSAGYRPATYDGPGPGIRALLEGMIRLGWKPVYEYGLPIALHHENKAITLEPGGQVELSGAAHRCLHRTMAENRGCHEQLTAVAEELGLCFLALGHQPKWTRGELPWMPKERYRIMGAYMSERGSLGLDMMQSTCSMHASVDFSSEADMVKKFRVAEALQPLAIALFANSPFVEGRPSGYLSYRSHIWSDTDPDRCGSLPFAFEKGMGFERYTDYVLDVPMYSVLRDGDYIDASGQSFRDFLNGRLAALPGEQPNLGDWENHLTSVFPDVRLKRYLEIRGADASQSTARATALAALWAGLLYDADSLGAAWECVREWSRDEHAALRHGTPRHGFQTPFRNETTRKLCLWMLELSRQGLQRRNCRDADGRDECGYLDPLQRAAETGRTFAENLIRQFHGEWGGDIDVAVKAMCEEKN